MIKRFFLSLITALCVVSTAFGQNAGLLFVSPQQFFNNNGNPLSGGKVYYYQPGTLTNKPVWSDANETTPLTNPVILNAAGRPNGAVAIYGEGTYRQIIKDANDNQIADIVTASGGGGGGGGGSTGDGDLVGTIKPWAGLIAPNQYAFAYGQELSRTTFNALYTAITYSTSVSCTSGSPILTSLSDTTQIAIGSNVELSCTAPGTTVISKTAITVTLSANSSITGDVTALFFPWGNGNGSTTFNLPDLRGYAIAGRDNMGGVAAGRLTTAYFNPGGTSDPDALGAVGGNQLHTMTLLELVAHTHTGTTGTESASHTHSGTTGSNSVSHTHTEVAMVQTGPAAPGTGTATWAPLSQQTGTQSANHTHSFTSEIESATHTHDFTTASTGSTAAFSVVQPSITLNYIIKIIPDTTSLVSTGVTSIESMTGDIACGTGLLCTGNIISITGGGGGGGGSPSSPDTSVQYNNSGNFGGTNLLTWVSPALFIGHAGAATGQLKLSGTTSGTITLQSQDAAGTFNFNLPITVGTSGQPLLSGGGGSTAMSWGTLSGNTTTFATTSGSLVSGNCAKFDASGNIVDFGGACGGTGSPGGANTQVQYNNSSSFGANANLTWVSPALTIGVAGSATGQLKLTGTTSGTITIQGQSAAGTYNFNLPVSAGSSNDVLTSAGGGASAMTWTTPGTLSKVDDTNVTLTLGGTPSTALLKAISLTVGWTGTLAVARGGTGIASGTSGGIPYFSAGTTITSSGILAANRLVLGGGAGAAPATLGSLGTTTTVLHGNAAGAPTFGAVSLANDVTDSLAISSLATVNANTMLGNWTSGTAAVSANVMPSCSTATSALNYTNGTGVGCRTNAASLTTADQTLSGGANVTALSQSTGNITVDCGARPLQYITNGGAFTITAPANDGSCILLVTNNGSAGTITFSGFSVGTNTGDALTTTNTNKFSIHIWRINGTSGYRIATHQ